MQSVAESSRRPGLRSADTADYIKRRIYTRSKFGERCFSNSGPALGIPYLTVLSLKSIKNSSLSSRVLTFVSAPGHFVSRAL